MVKEYPAENIVVIWNPEKCAHAGVCVKSLPQVYNLKRKPWIDTTKASTEELIAQIEKCPSGALSYRHI